MASLTIRSRRVPTTTFVPMCTVMGRSVFSRSVRHGIPRTVVSSWMPPESVITNLESSMRLRKAR